MAWLGALGRFRCFVALGLVCLLSVTVTWFVARLGCTLRTGMLTAEAIGAAIKGIAPMIGQDE